MFARWLLVAFLSGLSGTARAADACQDLATQKDLPVDYKLIGKSALGSAELHIRSNGTCTCNDLPAVQRSLGQAEPAPVNWACDAADAPDSKSK